MKQVGLLNLDYLTSLFSWYFIVDKITG